MIDCGALYHIAKREMKPVRAIFVTHAHMDHFMGFDAFLRQVHASPRTIEIFGPPGIAERVNARLSGYDWNLAEPYWCTFLVHEVHPGLLITDKFSGPEGFQRSRLSEEPRQGDLIFRHNHIEVSARLLKHGIPVLAFRVQETKLFNIDMEKLSSLGFAPGDWLRGMKRRFFMDWPEEGLLKVVREDNGIVREDAIEDAKGLYESISEKREAGSIGYLTDVAYSEENLAAIIPFLSGVRLLIGECAFLAGEEHKARSSSHLCTSDWNRLLCNLKPEYFLPMHLSKTYLGRSRELYEELRPPPGTTIIKLKEHLTLRPIFASQACGFKEDF
jgi:ribonuclease Z